MLAKIFNVFETTEIQLTPNAIKRLRASAVMSIPAIPLFAVIEIFNFSDTVNTILFAAGLISIAAMLYCFLTRLANRLWVPEKHLDEVEIERKRRSASLTLQLLIGIFALSVLLLLPFNGSYEAIGNLSATRAVVWTLGIIMCVSLSVQTAFAAWMTEPLSDVNAQRVAADGHYKWIAFAILAFCAAFGVIIIKIL